MLIMFVAYYALLSLDWNANTISVAGVIVHATGHAIFYPVANDDMLCYWFSILQL